MAVNTYYFDGHSGVADPNNVWSNDNNLFDGNESTGAYTTSLGSKTTNYLEGKGTEAPTSSGPISQVRGRVRFDDGSLTLWGAYAVLNAPAGGWTWAAINALETRVWLDDATGGTCEIFEQGDAGGTPLVSLEFADAGSSDAWVFDVQVEVTHEPPASFSTLTENWASGIDSGIWDNWGGANVQVSDGALQLSNGTGTTNYYGITTQSAYDLTGVSVAIELVSITNPVNTGDTSLSMTILNLEIDTNNRYFYDIATDGSSTLLKCIKATGGSYDEFHTEAFNVTNHKFVRIRESGGVVYFERSADGYNWTVMDSISSTGVAVTALYCSISIGHWAVVSNVYTFSVDNINLMPEPPASNSGAFFALLM